MKNLKRLALSFTLLFVFAVAAIADDPAPPCAPGETHGPPCSSAPQTATDNSVAPGQTETPPPSDTVDVIGIAEAALWSLLLF